MIDIDKLTDKIFSDMAKALGGPGSLNAEVRAVIYGNLAEADILEPEKREREIDAGMEQLIKAWKGNQEDEAGLTLLVMVGGFFKDVARIANALEASATYQAVDLGNRYGVEEQTDYGVEMAPEPEVERPWMEWDGRDHNGPPVEPWALVDIRYRQPSKGDRVPDETGISPLKVQWLHHGRPTNADIVGWRLSKEQPGAPGGYRAPEDIGGGRESPGGAWADPSATDTYNGAWIEYAPGMSYQPTGNRRVIIKLRDGSELRDVRANQLNWDHKPLGLGLSGSDGLDIVAWKPFISYNPADSA